jgi:PBP1b-binding outer membrane lipoprotein LpoB
VVSTCFFGFSEVIGDYNTNQDRLLQMQQVLPNNKTILKRHDGTVLHCGSFELVSLNEMRNKCHTLLSQVVQQREQEQQQNTIANIGTSGKSSSQLFGSITAYNIQANAYDLHSDPIAANGIIQAA